MAINQPMLKMNMWFAKNPGKVSGTVGGLIVISWLLSLLHAGMPAEAIMYAGGIVGTVQVALRAWSALKAKTISIELLVTIACLGAMGIGEPDEAAIVTFLFLFGNVLEARTLAKTRSAVKDLTDMAPEQADVVQADGSTVATDIDDIDEGDHVLVRPGGQVPVDGIVTSGTGRTLEAVITGEAKPVTKEAGDKVFAGTMLDSGTLTVETTAAGEDSTFGQIVELVEEAQDAQAPVARFIDKFATYYTPAVLIIAIIVGLVSRDISLAITMLVLGCPGALVIGAPVANVAGIGRAAGTGILFKGGATVASLAAADTLMLDKTGTITTGKMLVHTHKNFAADENAALGMLSAIERGSNHPLANAIVAYATQKGVSEPAAPDMSTIKGLGLASADGKYLVGNDRLLAKYGVTISADVQAAIDDAQNAGDSVVILAIDQQVALVVGVNDVVRPGAAVGLAAMKKNGIKKIVMLTGDNRAAAERIASELPIDEVRAELLPQEKLDIVNAAQKAGSKVAFVGDGINDAPALATADVGIGMGGGTAVALDTADVVLVKADFATLSRAVGLAKGTTRVTTQNIVIAVGTVVLLLLGLLVGIVHMGSGMFVHEASILLVIANALRLLNKK
ncbi:heavy metal translocating P-type ATPase [Lacticaseibacillus songhuajiangensis]|jgi:Cd2+/Zn2+-exporting ATPase|uniref:heavy metal translocating P-type ATPase n=1 Tax=Lacticaseibacillus songhuajiangensis TaxID=1296539 RepID=UPI001CDCB21C|nr:heavy metal translocating P-type ATPase [Lacticaseibacillus songhuajiangensis]